MSRLALLVLPCLVACAAESPSSPDVLLAAGDATVSTSGKDDASWDTAPTLHVGERVFGRADAHGRRVFPVWIAGRAGAPVPLDVTATSADGNSSVRVAVLGPLRNGTRTVLGAGGYASPRANVEISIDAVTSGEHLIVVGSHDLSEETFFHVQAHCEGCDPGATDVLSSPKAGALVATGTNLVTTQLGDVLADRTFDVELELWASPPMQSGAAVKVATSVASGTQANIIVPSSVHAGDDLRLVVRKAGGAVLDAGVPTRYFPTAAALVRTDAILYGDIASLEVAGVVGFFEGQATLALRSETRHREIAIADLSVDQPGQVGNGFNAFDATFAPELEHNGTLNPDLPHNGELLSIGTFNGNGDFRRLACFEYCNDLSGMETCTGGTRTCPTTPW